MRGWCLGLRTAVASWHVEREADALAHQAVKYQQRDGWSHSDLLRLAQVACRLAQRDEELAGRSPLQVTTTAIGRALG